MTPAPTTTLTATSSARDATASREYLQYRPHLDGLRAIAVYLVIAFHTGLHGFAGGFVGVDIFFVLSGFLVTRILLRDLVTGRRIDWRRFYSRRVRRILPAALATLLITAGIYSVIASPSEMQDVLGGFRAAFLYTANWFFVRGSTNYFAAATDNPVLHFWSLSVEEQFYLFWPLVLGALYLLSGRAGARRWWVLRLSVLTIGLASAAEALYLSGTDLNRAYYGTDTRAYQLLAGAFIALTPQLSRLGVRHRREFERGAFVVLGALVFVGTSALAIGVITRGIVAALMTAALIVALESARGGIARQFLSSKPLVYFGKISYGTYLWHWPVVVVVTRDRHVDPLPLFAITCVISTALAALSFHLMEHPLRRARALDRYKRPVIATGLALSLIAGLVLVPAILHRGNATVAGGVASASSRNGTGPSLRDWRVALHDTIEPADCYRLPVQNCIVVRGSGIHIMLAGDSNARMWIPTFIEMAKRRSFTLSLAVAPGCPWQVGLQFARPSSGFLPTAEVRRRCESRRKDWYDRVIPKLNPRILFLVHVGYDDPADVAQLVDETGKDLNTMPTFESRLQEASSDSLRALKRPGRRIVIIEPGPRSLDGFDPLDCLSHTLKNSRCIYMANRIPTPLERFYRKIALPPNLITVDLDRIICPRLPICDSVVDNIIVKWDAFHLTATYARSRTTEVEALLRRRGVLDSAG